MSEENGCCEGETEEMKVDESSSNDCEKQSRAVRNVDKSILDLFWKLVAVDQNTRLNACASITRVLLLKQSNHESSSEMCSDLQYCVDRLVRGMSSSREAARQGYSILLSQVLRLFPQVEVDDILKLIEKHLPATDRQDKCPGVIGQLLAYSSMVRSGRLVDSPYLSLVVMNLCRLMHGKSYVHVATHKLMDSLFSLLSEERFKNDVWSHLKSELRSGWEKSSADNLWLLLLVVRQFPGAVSQKFLKNNWGSKDLISDDTLDHWKRIIKQSTLVHPYLHPVCYELLQLCIQQNSLKKTWIPVVDENLFETDQSEKTYLGFLLVKEALQSTQKKKMVKTIMGPKFCFMLSRTYMNKRHPLYSAACDLVSFLSEYVKNLSYELQVIVLERLLQVPNTLILSRSKEVTAMISHLSEEAVTGFCEILKSIVFQNSALSERSQDEDDERDESMQISAVSQIGALVSHPNVSSAIEWRFDVIKFLFLHAYYVVSKPVEGMPEIFPYDTSTETFSPRLRAAFSRCFTNALGSINRKTALEQRLEVLHSLVAYWDCLLEVEDGITPLFDLTKIGEPWACIRRLSQDLEHLNKKGKRTVQNDALHLLLLQLGFHLFVDHETIPSVLEELEVCCRRSMSLVGGGKLVKNASEEEDSEPDDAPWIQVLVDLLLSLLSQPSHHLRCIVHSVFRLICPFVTVDALQLILDVINPKEDSEESPLIDESDESEDETDQETGGKSEDSSDDDDDDDNEEVDESFKLKLQNALGPMAEVDDMEEEVILSDSEMFKLDDALSAAFQSRKKVGHTQISPKQKHLLDFKIKCFDLVQCYLKGQPSLGVVLRCVRPVFSVYESRNKNRHSKQLVCVAMNTLRQISHIKKFKDLDDVEQSELVELLQLMIGKSQAKMTTKEDRTAVFCLCAFFVLCERKLKPNTDCSFTENLNSQCIKKYVETLEKFVKENKCRAMPQLFIKLMNMYPESAWLFLEYIANNAFDTTVVIFRRKQILTIFFSAMQFSKGLKSVTKEMWIELARNIVLNIMQELTKVNNRVYKDIDYASELLRVIVTLNTILKEKFHETITRVSTEELLALLMSTSIEHLSKKGRELRKKLITLIRGEVPDENVPKVLKKPKGKKRKLKQLEK